MRDEVYQSELLRKVLILGSSVVLLVSTVILEPQTAADMAIVAVATASLLLGLYLSWRAEKETAKRAEHEGEVLSAAPDVVGEEDELPRREPFGRQG